MHSFSGGADGANPYGNLLNIHDTLYGTTLGGGEGLCSISTGCGTIFSLNPDTGAEAVLHTFQGADGSEPVGSPIDIDVTLYGLTNQGGTYGFGALFAFRP